MKLRFLRLAVCIYGGGLEALSCEKTSPKNDLRFRAEFPVKLRFLRLAVCIYGGEVFAARKCAESPNIICK